MRCGPLVRTARNPASDRLVFLVMTTLRNTLVQQFGHPTGLIGQLAGWSMSHRPSNKQRNRWTVDLLRLQPGERVLEVGFGPGLALAHAAAAVGAGGLVAGIDRSAIMLSQARRRNARAIAAGHMHLRLASVERMPEFGVTFDAIFTVNTVGFWPNPEARLRDLQQLLPPGGRLAVTVQPRSARADAATSERVRIDLDSRLRAAGFDGVTTYTLPLDPPAVCAIGVRPPA